MRKHVLREAEAAKEPEESWRCLMGTDSDGHPGLRLEALLGDKVVFYRDMSVQDATGLVKYIGGAVKEACERWAKGERGVSMTEAQKRDLQ